MRLLKMLVALSWLIVFSSHAGASDLTGETWSVCGWDGSSSWHDTRLVFTSQRSEKDGDVLEGYFDWRSNRGSFGREHFKGILKPDGSLALQGINLEESLSIVTSRYLARLSKSGTVLTEGVWLDGVPGVWAAVRDGGSGSAASLCEIPDLSV